MILQASECHQCSWFAPQEQAPRRGQIRRNTWPAPNLRRELFVSAFLQRNHAGNEIWPEGAQATSCEGRRRSSIARKWRGPTRSAGPCAARPGGSRFATEEGSLAGALRRTLTGAHGRSDCQHPGARRGEGRLIWSSDSSAPTDAGPPYVRQTPTPRSTSP
jgi:hypothetical protein